MVEVGKGECSFSVSFPYDFLLLWLSLRGTVAPLPSN